MGSILSGRRNGKPLVENCLTLDLAWLMRLAPIRAGQTGNGETQWSVDGEQIGTACFRLHLHNDANGVLILTHDFGWAKARTQKIPLTTTRQPLGGYRWWMRCPITGRRARTLHLVPGGTIFASRDALGLAYRVERLNHFDRHFEKLFRAQRRLGSAQGLAVELKRPKGMWRRTYVRHAERLEALDIGCAQKIAALIEGT